MFNVNDRLILVFIINTCFILTCHSHFFKIHSIGLTFKKFISHLNLIFFMKNYVFSSFCKILEFNNLKIKNTAYPEQIAALENRELFLLEKGRDRFLINPTIKIFLDFFSNPATLAEVAQKMAHQAKCKISEITPTLEVFLEQMCAKKFLVSELVYEQEKEQKLNIDEPSISPLTTIEGYQFQELIFENSKVEIYKIVCLEDGKEFVAKKIKKANENEKNLRIFHQEFELLNALGNHPHICQFEKIIQKEETTFGLLEFVNGFSGRKYITRKIPPTSLSIRLDVLSQFFDAMAYVHQREVIHGDIHLSNLMIDVDNQLKLIDFNMSNRVNPLENEVIHEGGVYQYIAPEKLDGRLLKMVNGPASYRSEVYQMGVIAYFYLYEKMPFSGFTWNVLAQNILKGEPPFEIHTPMGEVIPLKIITFVKKMLCINPGGRFCDAMEVFTSWNFIIKENQLKVVD